MILATPRPRPPVVGTLPAGSRDAITDVAGVTVGHCTLAEGEVQTGVTVVRPHGGDPFRDKVPAAAVVLNGFGKSVGLVQVEEIGTLETPIALTNTFAVGSVATAQVRACIAHNPATGRALPTVNPLVFECNDGYLNDIQRMAVTEVHYRQALDACSTQVGQGAVGAGRGMSSFQMKGGIGTASRIASVGDGSPRTVGALVLANYGRLPQLVLAGHAVGATLAARIADGPQPGPGNADLRDAPGALRTRLNADDTDAPERGSIILLVATDAPLDARQLRRLALRAGAGLARTGSVFGHGSGDIALAFSTAYTVPADPARPMPAVAMLHDALLDPLFQAVADSTEQAIVHALWHARALTGRDGHHRPALAELLARGAPLLPLSPNPPPGGPHAP
ncbi:DmpA family aminopeptidase [Xylophilus ampelinus]|uniref:L-aminopeptidase DmpA n=1 Tax=Xylophilus ampelinus TaxID=54067 RepID=A0A318SN17_9BURK|nr:P1 family peptidase [Xylophilus ampelinus]MCS4510143.1 P1 family peptidase [Xylophilus ampelinus]PYE78293.1 L-aminopeptidase DmpA [Xylophilus ampelinus]